MVRRGWDGEEPWATLGGNDVVVSDVRPRPRLVTD